MKEKFINHYTKINKTKEGINMRNKVDNTGEQRVFK